jgi:hypothetical protein
MPIALAEEVTEYNPSTMLAEHMTGWCEIGGT